MSSAKEERAERFKTVLGTAMAEARTIRDKYIEVPHTTDFALLFLPIEGLYADSLGPPGSGADTIEGMLLANATKIAEALR